MDLVWQSSVLNRRPPRRLGVTEWLLVAASCWCGAIGCGGSTADPPYSNNPSVVERTAPPAGPSTTDVSPATTDVEPWFIDDTERLGLVFQHDPGVTGELLLPEVMGSGAALFDCDSDGDLDLLLVQGGPLDDATPRPGDTTAPPGDATRRDRPNHRLFRNDLDASAGRPLKFTDITESSGIQSVGYGMGVATGDYNNDGLVDLYITSLGSNQLLRNLGGGKFRDVTQAAGVDDRRWSTSATFFDYDRDGWLDLFCTNYVDFNQEKSPKCHGPSSARDYCGPDAFSAVSSSLFRNLRSGRFENVSESAGFHSAFGAGLGVVASDLNGDGWCDLYVANDGDPNQLWLNDGGRGTFTEDGLLAGVALNINGQAEAGMGVDAADVDGDGKEDLFITHLTGESDTLYINVGGGLFEDRTVAFGLRAPTLSSTSFGTRFLDFDHDGDLDLFVMNGAVRLQESLVVGGAANPLGQTNQLLRNDGRSGFRDISRSAGPAFAPVGVSRGAAVGDVDYDGDLDLLITNNGGPARLLLSTAAARTHWLGLRLVDAIHKSDVLQARVKITGPHGPPIWRRVHTDGSYLSASDPRLIAGLGQSTSPSEVTVYWPDGLIETWSSLQSDRYHTLRQTTGQRSKP